MRLNLRARLTLWAALATLLAVLLVAGGLYATVQRFLYQYQQQRLVSSVEIAQTRVEREVERDGGRWYYFDLDQIVAESEQTAGLQMRLVGLVDFSGGTELVAKQTARFPEGLPADLEPITYRVRGEEVLIVVRELRTSGRYPLFLTVATDISSLGEADRAFQQAFWLLLPLALLLSLIFGWTVSGRLLAPVRELEVAAQRVGESGELRAPLPLTEQGDELGRLARALQATFRQLAEARERERDFSRAAAHDLRSPLAALTARVQGSLSRPRNAERYRQDLQEIGTDLERLSALTTHLLLLSRDASALSRESVMLQPICADAVDRARELNELADVDLQVKRSGRGAQVEGDAVLLGQAVWNLVMNATKYGGDTPVTVTLESSADTACITVRDEGEGVSLDVLARLGQAFYRPDHSRQGQAEGGGHGLGLALARRAAEVHSGTLELSSTLGEGFSASLVLPLLVQEDVDAEKSAETTITLTKYASPLAGDLQSCEAEGEPR